MIHKLVKILCQNTTEYSDSEFKFFSHYKNPGINPNIMSCQVYKNKKYQFEVTILERNNHTKYQLMLNKPNGFSSSIEFSNEEKIEKYIQEKFPNVFRHLQKKMLEMM